MSNFLDNIKFQTFFRNSFFFNIFFFINSNQIINLCSYKNRDFISKKDKHINYTKEKSIKFKQTKYIYMNLNIY